MFCPFWACGANFFALAPTSGRAGRQISRTARRNMATLRPTTPPLTRNKAPLKPPSPLRPQTAPKTPISGPQRRWRFHSHTGSSEQRRRWFQTTGPHGRQGQAAAPEEPKGLAAAPVGGRAWLRHPWAAGPGRSGRRRHHRQPNLARNLSRSFFEMSQKRCNSNDANSMFE